MFNFDFDNTVFKRNKDGELEMMYEVGKYYKIQTNEGIKHFKYIGNFDSINDVPLENCLFCINFSGLYCREIDYNKLFEMKFNSKKTNNKSIKIVKDDKSLDMQPYPDDNILLILLKLLMQYRGLTESGFKNLFDNVSEMNNMKRLIFSGNGALSWQKFISMTEKLNSSVVIQIIDRNKKEDNIITSNNNFDKVAVPLPDTSLIINK